jgi:hypothetical protein
MDAVARESKIVKYLDMPLQHSSDRLLRAKVDCGMAYDAKTAPK